jgi:DNA sulfur modification protein DndD
MRRPAPKQLKPVHRANKMIIDKLTLHNFGVYGGRHEIELTPTNPDKPITLFGGLNGGGKTTFLDALLLVLYGKFAKCSNRGNLSYDDYLRKCINRNVSAQDGAAVELEFRHRQSNVEESIKVSRSWRPTGKSIREDVTVYRNGKIDPESTERWYEFIEELIPSRIANLFFFDGEKIEDLATPEHAANLLRTGIHALLGLDLIETLEQDLKVIERRRKARLGTTEDQEKLLQLNKELDVLNKQRSTFCQQKASCKTKLDHLDKERRGLEQSYKDEGGDLYDQRIEITTAHERATRELMMTQDRMREVAAGDAPLLLVEGLLNQAHEQCVRDKEIMGNTQSLDLLERRDHKLLNHMAAINADRSIKELVEEYLTTDRQERSSICGQDPIIGVEPEALGILHSGQLAETRGTINDLIAHASRLEDDIAELDRRLESIPDPAGLAGISTALKDNEKQVLIVEHKLADFGEKQDQSISAIERKQSEIDNLLDANLRSKFAKETSSRVISQTQVTRSLLSEYRTRMGSRHVQRLEQLVLESYQLLMRKKSIIANIKIDAATFEPTLYAENRDIIPLDRLSAGERQLLAVAILWGLSKASGRPLPTVIDTPLGRLDGTHRENLVNSYFPAASHQVILLSTDKEIDEQYYVTLRKSLGREYSIEYDETIQSSQVVDGYFWKGAA